MVEFGILRGGSRAKGKISAMGFRRAYFGVFRNLLGGICGILFRRAGSHSLIASDLKKDHSDKQKMKQR